MDKKQKNMVSATRLRELREKAGLSQSDLASLSRYTPQTISYYETGNRRITYEAARIFSTIFKVRVEYIMGEDDFPDEESMGKPFLKIGVLQKLAFDTLLKELSVSISQVPVNYDKKVEDSLIEALKGKGEASDVIESMQNLQWLWIYKNKCIAVTNKECNELKKEILDYLRYKLEQLFQNHNATEIPGDMVFEVKPVFPNNISPETLSKGLEALNIEMSNKFDQINKKRDTFNG